MTREEYDKLYAELTEQAREIARKKVELEKEYIAGLGFKVGDKFKSNSKCVGRTEVIGWITDIRVCVLGAIDIRYNPPKKDGTRSDQNRREILDVENIIILKDEQD